jgi:hypothetical protein
MTLKKRHSNISFKKYRVPLVEYALKCRIRRTNSFGSPTLIRIHKCIRSTVKTHAKVHIPGSIFPFGVVAPQPVHA